MKTTRILPFISFLGYSATVQANGQLPYCTGYVDCGLGGAGAAYASDASNANNNPALMVRLKNEMSIGNTLLRQTESVDTSKTTLSNLKGARAHTGPQKNRLKTILPGFGGINYHLAPQWSVGVSLNGGGGLVKYTNSILSPALNAPSKVIVKALLLSPTISWQPTQNQSYGLSLILSQTSLETNALTPALTPTRGSGRETVYGSGMRLGGLWDVTPLVTLGASLNTPVKSKKFKKYRDAFLYSPDMPMIATVGSAWHLNPKTEFLLAYDEVFWHNVKSTGKSPALGGQGWRNTPVIKAGLQYKWDDAWTLRAGYNFGKTPIPKSQLLASAFNAANAYVEHTFVLGFSYKVSANFDVDNVFAVSPEKRITDNGTGFLPAAKNLKMKARQYLIGLGIKYRF